MRNPKSGEVPTMRRGIAAALICVFLGTLGCGGGNLPTAPKIDPNAAPATPPPDTKGPDGKTARGAKINSVE